jgi:hypothetical protein
MGTANQAERSLYQGLIKLAAGYVHAVRGNPIGFARNLQGARELLELSLAEDPEIAHRAGIQTHALIGEIDVRLAAAGTATEQLAAGGGALIDLLPPAPRIR